jgi:hypothetical protein
MGLTRAGQVMNVTCPDTSLTLATGAVSVKLDPARAITLVAAGIGVNADANTQVITSNTLAVRLDPAGALGSSAAGVKVAADATTNTTQIVSNQLAVKLDPARAITAVAAGIGINIDATTLAISSNILGVKAGVYMPIMGTGNRVTREVCGGAFPGTAYTLAHAPTPVGCEEIFLNGILLQSGAGNDYTISGAAITMLATTSAGDKLLANYWY